MFDKFTYSLQLGSFAANHEFQHNGTFAIDLYFFRCLPLPNRKLLSPQLIWAEIPFWLLSTKLPLVKIHMYTVRPFSITSLTSTQHNTANNDKITCAAKQQLRPHPTKNAATSSSSSSLDSPIICPDLLPMIRCRLFLHLSPMTSWIPTFYSPPDSCRSIHVAINFSSHL